VTDRPIMELVSEIARSSPTHSEVEVEIHTAMGDVAAKLGKEPVAWYGPIVMITQEELRHAFAQLDDGTFLRPDAPR
jgi:redox-sensitive bicupin YhaK (pirin superfamily)